MAFIMKIIKPKHYKNIFSCIVIISLLMVVPFTVRRDFNTNLGISSELDNPSVTIDGYDTHVEFLEGSLQVDATITDLSNFASIQLEISRSDDSLVAEQDMTLVTGDLYTGTWRTIDDFPGNYTFTIVAEDEWGNINDTESQLFELVNTHQKTSLWSSLPGTYMSDVKISEDGNYIVAGGSDKIYLSSKSSV